MILLASSSIYRKTQLQQLGLTFEQTSPDIDETPNMGETPRDLASRLAQEKASACSRHENLYEKMLSEEKALIIGCDQTAALGQTLLGKPGSSEKAIEQLSQCSNSPVIFYSALCLLNPHEQTQQLSITETKVHFRHLSDEQIRKYVKKDNPIDCAGGFKCESLGIALFKSIESSDPSALAGLPLISLVDFLYKEGVNVL